MLKTLRTGHLSVLVPIAVCLPCLSTRCDRPPPQHAALRFVAEHVSARSRSARLQLHEQRCRPVLALFTALC